MSQLKAEMLLSLRDRLSGRMRKVRDSLGRAGKDARAMGKDMRAAAGGSAELARRQSRTHETTQKLTRSQKRLAEGVRSTNEAYRAQATAMERIERRQKALLRLTDRMRNRARDRRNQGLALGAGMGIAGAAGYYGGQRILRPTGQNVMAYATLEEQLDSVAAVTRIKKGSKDYLNLKAQAQHLGATTSFTSLQAAQGQQYLGMAGFDPKEIIDAMPGVLDLSKATRTDLGETANISSDILSGFNLPASEMNRVSDVLVGTTTRSNTNLTMLGDTMKYVGANATALGISMEETAAMAGVLADSGLKGSMGGTALRAMFSRLAAPPKAAQDALDELGVSAVDANGNMRPILDVLSDLNAALDKVGGADRMRLSKAIAGEEAGTGFLLLTSEEGLVKVKQLTAELNNAKGEAASVSKGMSDNLGGDLKGAGSAFSSLAETLGESVNPEMRELTKTITSFTRGINEWLKQHPNVTKGLMLTALALGVLTVAGGGLLMMAGAAVTSLAVMRYGMALLGIRALKAGIGVGRIGKAFKGLSNLKPLRWATFIPKLLWKTFVTPLKWAAYLPKLAWRGIVAALKWATLIPKIKWVSMAGKLSWRLLITPLKWGARLIPGIGWALLAGELLWSLLVKPLGWDGYIKDIAWGTWIKAVEWANYVGDFSWSEIVGTVKKLDWSGWIEKVDLREAGREAVQSLWDGMKEKFVEFLNYVKSIPSLIINAIGSIDLSNAIKFPSFGGGGSSASAASAAAAPPAKPSFKTADEFARGGTVRRDGPILVGEEGPEFLYGSQGDYIAHNRNLRSMVRRAALASTVAAVPMAAAAETAEPLLPRLQQVQTGTAQQPQAVAGTAQGGTAEGGTTITIDKIEITIKEAGDPNATAEAVIAKINKRLGRRLSD